MDAEASPQIADAVQSTAGAKVKVRRETVVRFPVQFHMAITPAMKASMARMSHRLLLAEGVIGRLALMQYLAANDPSYSEDDRGNSNGAC